ncbi:hypothetical protein PQJ75_00780 [Rhodoplanes sp. TEM]|uniref:Uncharacterized protein n=1 Tax=Rhodoplanes tepidamans TaxID=200616 RepID=A0ABT5J588_RHOTP|nr:MULTISPECIES: hypothetical protein [Rhodoplanes]MDC7784787.1 hypothetical protein [Rhodoplanes tepidamans]MDC7982254.1 hypothetical protein [Rhodoplanes sp. TEM]MDQ0356261.1 hypothetical protein [Rhodoplanes tepidamans]
MTATTRTAEPAADMIADIAHRLMRAVVATGVVTNANIDTALVLMREEMRRFLTGPEYSMERELLPTRADLVWKTPVATCVAQIAAAGRPN